MTVGSSDPTATGRYEWQDSGRIERDVWWVPPRGAPREHLATTTRDDLGPVAATILHHAAGSLRAVNKHWRAFLADLLDGRKARRGELRAPQVEEWLHGRGIPLAPGWGPAGPEPVISRSAEDPQCYTVALDGFPVVLVDLPPAAGTAKLTVIRPDHVGSRPSTHLVRTSDGHDHDPAGGERVTARALPFGGWAVRIDGTDAAELQRDRRELIEQRVAIYDRGLDSGVRVFDNTTTPAVERGPFSMSERLRQFASAPGRQRVLGR